MLDNIRNNNARRDAFATMYMNISGRPTQYVWPSARNVYSHSFLSFRSVLCHFWPVFFSLQPSPPPLSSLILTVHRQISVERRLFSMWITSSQFQYLQSTLSHVTVETAITDTFVSFAWSILSEVIVQEKTKHRHSANCVSMASCAVVRPRSM